MINHRCFKRFLEDNRIYYEHCKSNVQMQVVFHITDDNNYKMLKACHALRLHSVECVCVFLKYVTDNFFNRFSRDSL